MNSTSKVVCGPSKRWLTGEVEFWCERHAYAKTMYPTGRLEAEDAAEKHGWRQLKNGSWQCPWCVGPKNSYLKKFEWEFFYGTGVYFRPHSEWRIVMTPELEEAMRRAFQKRLTRLEKSKVRVRKRAIVPLKK